MSDSKTETQKYFNNLKMSDQEIAASLGVSYVTVGRWRRGEKIPQKYHKERLQKLAVGSNYGSNLSSANESKWLNSPDDRLYQLTIQIQMLQESIGGMKVLTQQLADRVEVLEGKKKPSSPPVHHVKGKV